MFIALSLLSASLFGIADFSCGLATRRNSPLPVVFLSQLGGTALLLVVIGFIPSAKPALSDFLWGAIAGLTGVGGLALLYRGIAGGVVAIVAPVSAISAALIPVVFGLILGERPSMTAIAGGAACIPAILFLSIERGGDYTKEKIRSSLLHGLFAGCLLGGFYVAISRTDPGSGLWPLLAARFAALLALIVSSLFLRKGLIPMRGTRLSALAGGLCDMAANIAFLFASRIGLLMVVSVLSSLYPAPTVVLARIVFKQRLGALKLAGLALAIGGVILIALP